MLDKSRYLQRAKTVTTDPGFLSLTYAICAHGALLSRYCGGPVEALCYSKAREHLLRTEADTGTPAGTNIQALQASLLVAMYEFKRMHFSRAFINLGRAVRMALIMGLHRMDQPKGLPVSVASRQPRGHGEGDLQDGEEKRRTFWSTFILDRCSNVGTDWPMMIDENEVRQTPLRSAKA